MKQKENDKKTLAWIIACAKGKKRYVAIMVLIKIVMALFASSVAILLGGIMDAAQAGDWERFKTCCILIVVWIIVQCVLQIISQYLDEYTRSSLENSLKHRLFDRLLTGDYAAVTATHSGEWLNRLTSDAAVVAGNATGILPGIIGASVRIVAVLAMMVVIAPQFGAVFIVGGSLVVILSWGLRRLMKKLHRQVQVADGELRVFLSERLGSLMVIRAFEQEDTVITQADQLMTQHKKMRMRKANVNNVLNSGFSFAVSFVYIASAIYCGYGILTGTMSYGDFVAMQQLVAQAQAPISNMSSYFPHYSSMLASAERLMEAEQYCTEQQVPMVEDVPTYYRESFKNIGLRHAGFTYLPVGDADGQKESRPTVLKNLDMEISKGEYVAFCGPSGCGKSTVLKLLMSMYTLDAGQRYVTDAEGERPLTAAGRGLFAYVPQGNQLMSGTIRDVVTFAAPEGKALDQKVYRALEIACADQFVSELPEGLDTLLGERGAGLSEGQMQRIAIARAIYSERPILLLDEATSALDEQTEAKVLDNLRSMTDKTVIIVTHRPAALEITDKIITFKPNED